MYSLGLDCWRVSIRPLWSEKAVPLYYKEDFCQSNIARNCQKNHGGWRVTGYLAIEKKLNQEKEGHYFIICHCVSFILKYLFEWKWGMIGTHA